MRLNAQEIRHNITVLIAAKVFSGVDPRHATTGTAIATAAAAVDVNLCAVSEIAGKHPDAHLRRQ